MPTNIPDAYFLMTSALGVLGMAVIGFLLKRGFDSIIRHLTRLDTRLDVLGKDLQNEREDRIQHYGDLRAELAAQRAICNERHGRPVEMD